MAQTNEIDQITKKWSICLFIFRFLQKGEWSSELPDNMRSRSMRNTCHSHEKYGMYLEGMEKQHRQLINYLRNKNYKVSNKQNFSQTHACALRDRHTLQPFAYLA